jgi:ABC-type glycerol-3-phosphate transport system substrate-binding protein
MDMNKKLAAGVLAAVMLTGCLAGCGKKTSGSASGTSSGGATSSAGAQTTAKYVYTADYVDVALDKGNTGIGCYCASGDYAYVSSQIVTDAGSGTGGSVSYAGSGDAAASSADGSDAAVSDAAVSSAAVDVPAGDGNADGGGAYVAPTSKTVLYRIDLKTGESTTLDAYQPLTGEAGFQGDCSIGQMFAGADGSIWVCDSLNTYKYDLPADFNAATDDQSQYYVQGQNLGRVQQFSADGQVLATISLQADKDGNLPYICAVDQNNNLYAIVNTDVLVYDKTGKTVKTISLGDAGGSLIPYNGGAAVEVWGQTTQLKAIDPETFALGDPIDLPQGIGSIYKTNDEGYDFLYDNNGSIYGYKIEEKTSDKVVDWLDDDVNSNDLVGYTVLSDGRVLGFLNQPNSDGSSNLELVLLTRTNSADVKPKTVLKLACLYVDWSLRNQIVAFNKASDKYRIVVEDYSQYATNGDNTAAVTKLNTEIISGKVPDLLYTSGMPISQYASQGLLEDLLPYVNKDADLGENCLLPEVLAAAETNGHLYRSFSNFSINTAVGLDKVVGGYSSWTLNDLKDAMTKLQSGATVFSIGLTKTDVLNACINRSLSSFIDWNKGTCTFDSQDFRDILEFSNTFPATFDWDNFDWNSYLGDQKCILSGTQLLVDTTVGAFYDYMNQLAMYNGEAVDFIGYPTQTGTGNTFALGEGVCITSACADKDAAWSFVRQYFTEDFELSDQNYGFAFNAKAFQKQIDEAQTVTYQTDENGNTVKDDKGNPVVQPMITYQIDDTHTITYDSMSQEQLDQFMTLYKSCKTISGSDASVLKIVTDEAAAYFAGEKTLDETVSMIQNRASLYVAEQK